MFPRCVVAGQFTKTTLRMKTGGPFPMMPLLPVLKRTLSLNWLIMKFCYRFKRHAHQGVKLKSSDKNGYSNWTEGITGA